MNLIAALNSFNTDMYYFVNIQYLPAIKFHTQPAIGGCHISPYQHIVKYNVDKMQCASYNKAHATLSLELVRAQTNGFKDN